MYIVVSTKSSKLILFGDIMEVEMAENVNLHFEIRYSRKSRLFKDRLAVKLTHNNVNPFE